MQEESPEGGRFKKEVIIDGQSYLLLIRDEGGQPEMQFTHWVDAVIFVFSLENEDSFLTVHQYYLKMCQYRNMSDVPFILVGTQDYITDQSPRCVDDARARSLANELKKCSYFETCATYGLHVERVFHDACQKVVNLRTQLLCAMATITNASSNTNRPTTPQQSSIRLLAGSHQQAANGISSISASTISSVSSTNGVSNSHTSPQQQQQQQQQAFYLANPHLLNAAALHCTITNQPNNLNGNHINNNNQNTVSLNF
jgi:Arf-GAP/GTPase/ANK repeat/PH domain-containing protein 1/3